MGITFLFVCTFIAVHPYHACPPSCTCLLYKTSVFICLCFSREDGLLWRSEYGLDDEAEGAIAVNIVPLLGKSERLKKQARIKPGLRYY